MALMANKKLSISPALLESWRILVPAQKLMKVAYLATSHTFGKSVGIKYSFFPPMFMVHMCMHALLSFNIQASFT